MDDPGLSGITIQDLTIHVSVIYLDGGGPDPAAVTGEIDFGYRTGTGTIWHGSTFIDTGTYNTDLEFVDVSSATYTLDSDNGTLDLDDINNLQIAVQRNTAGSPQLRVTEVYVEVTYFP